MLNYILRRVLYSIPIIFGVMVITFILFYLVQTPEQMARRQLGPKASKQALEVWLHNRGYDKPVFINTRPNESLFDSQFFHHVLSLARFDLGKSDSNGRPVVEMFKEGAIPSLLITFPTLICGLFTAVGISLFLMLVRESFLDKASIILCVALMSLPYPMVMYFFHWLGSLELSWFPAFGFDKNFPGAMKFLALPIFIAVFSGLGSEVRLYRAIFLEEVHQDYIRTAHAKGLGVFKVLFKHVFKNGLISLITLVVAGLPVLIMGSLILENFFGIPGLGNLSLNAIRSSDFRVMLSTVYLASIFFLVGLMMTDICYAWADPRIRLK